MIAINHYYLKLQVEFRNIYFKVVSAINNAILNSNCFMRDYMGDFPKFGHIWESISIPLPRCNIIDRPFCYQGPFYNCSNRNVQPTKVNHFLKLVGK